VSLSLSAPSFRRWRWCCRPPAAVGAAPPIGTAAEQADLGGVAGSEPYAGGWAIPLRAERPSWYTPALAARVDAANGVPVAAPTDAPLPGEVGIRPVLVEIGTISVSHDNGVGDDFALVPIRAALNSWGSPTIAVVAGPCGAYGGSGPETVWHGHGLGIGTGGTPRAGLALTWQANAFGWDGAAIFGDSGSAVRVGTGLAAAGDLTHVVDTRWLPSFIAGTRIGKIQQIAGGWSLVSSPICI
jgi:hypothetical protein